MARIYSPNEGHSCDYGVDFTYGAAAVPDTNTNVIAWFQARDYTVVSGSNILTLWDLQPAELLRKVAPYVGVTSPESMTKAQLVTAIETALITLMKIEITAFDDIIFDMETANKLDGGKVGAVTYADANAVEAVLPGSVTATFANGIKVTVPVTAWADTNSYNAASDGEYVFTATLGSIPTPFANTASTGYTVKVVVAADSG